MKAALKKAYDVLKAKSKGKPVMTAVGDVKVKIPGVPGKKRGTKVKHVSHKIKPKLSKAIERCQAIIKAKVDAGLNPSQKRNVRFTRNKPLSGGGLRERLMSGIHKPIVGGGGTSEMGGHSNVHAKRGLARRKIVEMAGMRRDKSGLGKAVERCEEILKARGRYDHSTVDQRYKHERGVHSAAYAPRMRAPGKGGGISEAGSQVRRAKRNLPEIGSGRSAMVPARAEHRRVLAEMRSMPKPKLGKALDRCRDLLKAGGTRVPHINHAVYRKTQKMRHYNGEVSPLTAHGSTPGKMLRSRLPHYKKEDHLQAAAHHEALGAKKHKQWEHKIHEAHHATYGKAPVFGDYKISGIGDDKYPEHMKPLLRKLAHESSAHSLAAHAHRSAAKGMRSRAHRPGFGGAFTGRG